MLDWKGRMFKREEIDGSLLKELLKSEGSELTTVCISDPELMDAHQMQCIAHCMESSPTSANFVVLTVAPKRVSPLIQSTTIVFDTTETCSEEDYKTSSMRFFNCIFKKETGFELDQQGVQVVEKKLSTQPPDTVAQVAVSLGYAYVEMFLKNQFGQVENWLQPALDVALNRLGKIEGLQVK